MQNGKDSYYHRAFPLKSRRISLKKAAFNAKAALFVSENDEKSGEPKLTA